MTTSPTIPELTSDDIDSLVDSLVRSVRDDATLDLADAIVIAQLADGADADTIRNSRALNAFVAAWGRNQ